MNAIIVGDLRKAANGVYDAIQSAEGEDWPEDILLELYRTYVRLLETTNAVTVYTVKG